MRELATAEISMSESKTLIIIIFSEVMHPEFRLLRKKPTRGILNEPKPT